MSEAIYIQHGQALTRMELTKYSREDDFQALLEAHVDLLAGDQVNPKSPRRWLLIKREAGIPGSEGGKDRWSLDHLFIDQDATPTLVEIKRQSDTRLRREVVGQMMDYAANATVYWPGETLKDLFYQTATDRGETPETLLADFLKGSSFDGSEEEFWQEAHRKLRAGDVRLIFVADRIPPELQRIVEFLNERMSPTEVLALELRRYSGGEFSTHIPRIIGQTSAAQIAKNNGIPPKSAHRLTWTEADFVKYLIENFEDEKASAIQKVLDFCRASKFNKIEFGTGQKPSLNPKCLAISKCSPITIWPDGQLSIKLSWLDGTETSRAFRDKFQAKLREAGLPYEYLDLPGRIISVAISDWMEWTDQLLEAMRGAAEEVLNPEVYQPLIDPSRLSRFGDAGDEVHQTWSFSK
ncbi:hypothetical protein [Leptolyngbya sp. KIOST-1]|uniref:hypothetical protein n=1 Tax=Leptolyngbya sp. KIOST-1 TaxID=1229172 RepID=UPI0006925C56|nr:hypothetical protein [Leptolyngbya sp. KIOST-1]